SAALTTELTRRTRNFTSEGDPDRPDHHLVGGARVEPVDRESRGTEARLDEPAALVFAAASIDTRALADEADAKILRHAIAEFAPRIRVTVLLHATVEHVLHFRVEIEPPARHRGLEAGDAAAQGPSHRARNGREVELPTFLVAPREIPTREERLRV